LHREVKLTWLAPSSGQSRHEFLHSVYELTKSFPEPLVATAIPIEPVGRLAMLHVVAGTREGDLTQFGKTVVERFESLSAEVLAGLTNEEMASAQQALEARVIGALSGASSDELAVVVGTARVADVQERIAALLSEL
jgi:hypothetical protein